MEAATADVKPPREQLLTLWPAVYDLVQLTLLFGGVASLVSCLLVVLFYALLRRVRRTPGWLVLRGVLCELIVSVGFIGLYFYGDSTQEFSFKGEKYSYLLVLLVSLTTFEVAAHMWRLLMYVDLGAIYRNPFHPNRYRGWYPPMVIVVSLAASNGAAMKIFTSNQDEAVSADEAALLLLSCGFIFVPFALFALGGGALLAAVHTPPPPQPRPAIPLRLVLARPARRAPPTRLPSPSPGALPRRFGPAGRGRRRRLHHFPRASARHAPLRRLPALARVPARRRADHHAAPRHSVLRGRRDQRPPAAAAAAAACALRPGAQRRPRRPRRPRR